MYFVESCSNQIALVAVVCSVISALVSLVVSTIVFRLWHRKQISKRTQFAQVSAGNASHVEDEIPLGEMAAVTQQTERKNMMEYEELGEREIINTPDTYQTIRVV